MKNQYILGLIAGASLMLALVVLIGAKDDGRRFEIKYDKSGIPKFAFDTSTADVFVRASDSGNQWKQIMEIK